MSTKYTFKAEGGSPSDVWLSQHPLIIFQFESDSLSEILEKFTNFLRACGYSIRGSLDIIEEELHDD